MHGRTLVAALCLSTVFAFVGCSAEVRDYQNALGDWSASLSSNAGPQMQYDQAGKAIGYDGAEARQFVDALDGLLGQLEQITPPQELAGDHDRVVAAFRGVCEKQEQFWDAFFQGDFAATTAAGDAVSTQMDEFTDAWSQLTEAIDEAR